MKINILINNKSYIPEAYAYKRYLDGLNHQTTLLNLTEIQKADLVIEFMGFKPFYEKFQKNTKYIHEYGSLSIPPFSFIKNKIKYFLNSKPSGRIFLNPIIKHDFGFGDKVRFIYRDMGIDIEFFNIGKINQNSSNIKKEYDLVYCGSIVERVGFISCLIGLAKLGFKILLIGNISKKIKDIFSSYNNIETTGLMNRNFLPDLYSKAKCGLNYTPNIYPFNFQTSTKTLEYCAAKMGVVSSKYFWSENFAASRGAKFLWLEDLQSKEQFDNFDFTYPDVSNLEWSQLLDRANFAEFINNSIK